MEMADRINDLRLRREQIEKGGPQAKADKQHDAKKMTARERISYLFDEGSFSEIGAFIRMKSDKTDAPAEGVVCGFGSVSGRLVYAYAEDRTVINGALGEMNSKKIADTIDMAVKMGAPVVAMSDSGGVRIAEGVEALGGLGSIIAKKAAASGVIPQIEAVMGPAAGGAAIAASMADFVFMVEDTSVMYMNGPSVLSGKAGRNVGIDEAGSAAFNAKTTGAAHFLASGDEECLDMIKKLISYLPSNNLEDTPYIDPASDTSCVGIGDIISDNGYDMKNVIEKIADAGNFFEISDNYAKNIITGFIRLNGSTAGVIANAPSENDGELTAAACKKAARFISFLDAFNIPVLSLTDTAGFYAHPDEEISGEALCGAEMIYAYSEATVAKVNVIIKKAYGSAYLAMGAKQTGADLVIAWPSAEVSVMGPEGAANLIFGDEKTEEKDPIAAREKMIASYREKYLDPYYTARYGFIDDIIEPDDTRSRVIEAFDMLLSKREMRPAKKHGNLPL